MNKISGKIFSNSIRGGVASSYAVDGIINLGDGRGGTSDYQKLINKPKIEGIELIGDKTFNELGLEECSNEDILAMFQE